MNTVRTTTRTVVKIKVKEPSVRTPLILDKDLSIYPGVFLWSNEPGKDSGFGIDHYVNTMNLAIGRLDRIKEAVREALKLKPHKAKVVEGSANDHEVILVFEEETWIRLGFDDVD